MKKLLIAILIILLGTAVYMLIFKNIEVGTWKSTNFEELKTLDATLNQKIEEATKLNEQEYVGKIDDVQKSINTLKKTKANYESKVQYYGEEAEVGAISIKNYKIEYLWTVLENYAKNRQIWLKLDLIESGSGEDTYNINVTTEGSYTGITDFISDIEKNDTFDFKIEEFKMTPKTVGQTSSTSEDEEGTQVADTGVIQAIFSIKNIRVELD